MGAVTQAQHWRAKFRIRIPVPSLKYGISDDQPNVLLESQAPHLSAERRSELFYDILVDGEVNDDTVWCYPIRSSSPWSPIHYAMEDDHVQISSPAVPVI